MKLLSRIQPPKGGKGHVFSSDLLGKAASFFSGSMSILLISLSFFFFFTLTRTTEYLGSISNGKFFIPKSISSVPGE